MKTPREILFARHRDAEPKLDAIRRLTLQQLAASPKSERDLRTSARQTSFPESLRLLLDWFRPLRWHLAGLAAVWLAILVLHSDTAISRPSLAGNKPNASSPQLQLAFREHRRQLLELTESAPPKPAPVSSGAGPKRRSDVRLTHAFV
jgi:hypothetical protein